MSVALQPLKTISRAIDTERTTHVLDSLFTFSGEDASHRTELLDATALTSPAQQLPVELLAEVMSLAASSSPFQFAHVCRLWRNAAFGNARLWTQLKLSLRQACKAGVVDYVESWCQRAGKRGLSLTISEDNEYRNVGPARSPLLDVALQRLAPRLRELDIMCPPPWLDFLVKFPGGSFCKLQALHIKTTGWLRANEKRIFDASTPPAQCLLECPALRSVHIQHLDHILSESASIITALPLPWAQIQDLKLGSVHTPQEWDVAFLQCANLITAEIDVADHALPEWPTNGKRQASIVTYSALTTLKLRFKRFPSEVLDAARFPALESLTLEDNHEKWGAFDAWSSLLRLAECSQGLTTLEFAGHFVLHPHEQELEQVLRQLPALTNVTFHRLYLKPALVLDIFSDEPTRFPSLLDLRFTSVNLMLDSDDDYYSNEWLETAYEAIGDFLKARQTASLRFRNLDFTLDGCEVEEDGGCMAAYERIMSIKEGYERSMGEALTVNVGGLYIDSDNEDLSDEESVYSDDY
ncbi:uncharacterized protein SCHCODRAFT_02560090 [Schizophyllum commune H4-8]|uniref:F-box domain-containing protein n=1 Tax=Schizophyllum commune (strain H4-8 / FGSC 9210) TaxID=578458 RepID=D8PTN4_SCHCM|nr:uncharacterized protein SCHCODRAFT_02560090 [Schizophyllum commune H4-8]KAI5899236.1 hypothetical protein SCHCODRAFT_02560090 [Schizophyllum commune H4-8]